MKVACGRLVYAALTP
ncbi:hypothetical protein M2G91_22065 [Vibrio vulnificus]|nr:hypothetical protein [Vibrio vulnificus]MCU8194962.1 hypothetical protein [Vibrio vulnificus]